MRDGWTFADRARLLSEALTAGDEDMVGRIFLSDHFEPSLGAEGGLGELINVTPAEKAAERARVKALYVERASIKAKWA